MEIPEVIIKCRGAGEIAIDDLHPLHHFKTLTDEDYARGRNVLIERGFKFSFSVWVDPEGIAWTVDGHQRTPILKRMREEGVKLPDKFPVDYVFADNKEDAAKDIIASETKFADINPTEFTDFLKSNEIIWEDVDSWAKIPELQEEKKSDGGSKTPKEIECPYCKAKFTP